MAHVALLQTEMNSGLRFVPRIGMNSAAEQTHKKKIASHWAKFTRQDFSPDRRQRSETEQTRCSNVIPALGSISPTDRLHIWLSQRRVGEPGTSYSQCVHSSHFSLLLSSNLQFKTFSRRFCPKQLSYSYIHKPMAVAATQGADQHIRSSLGVSILPKDTLACRPGESNQRPAYSSNQKPYTQAV